MPSSRYADTVAPEPPPKPKRLEQRLAEAVRARGFSLETEKAYGMWTRQFILHFDVRHPEEMGGAEVQEFLTHLAVDRELRGSSQAQCLNALVFLYRFVLDRPLGDVSSFVKEVRIFGEKAWRRVGFHAARTCNIVRMVRISRTNGDWRVPNTLSDDS